MDEKVLRMLADVGISGIAERRLRRLSEQMLSQDFAAARITAEDIIYTAFNDVSAVYKQPTLEAVRAAVKGHPQEAEILLACDQGVS